MASIYSKQDKCNRLGVQFRRPFDFSATPRQGCLKRQGCRAKLQPCGENSVFAASMCLYQRRRTSVWFMPNKSRKAAIILEICSVAWVTN